MMALALNLINSDATTIAINLGLEKYSRYQLVITGHSLGAGVASLVLIYLYHHNHPWVSKGVRCIGFGCPPVFGAPKKPPSTKGSIVYQRVKNSMAKIVCFINNEDIVPFLSIDSIRRLANTLEKVKNLLETWSIEDCLQNVRDPKCIPPQLLSIVEDGSKDLEQISGAERLKIPGEFVVWIDSKSSSIKQEGIDASAESLNVVLCKPSILSNLAIWLSVECILDHLPPRYEESFAMLVKES
jgi:hypothetical protein